MRLHLPFPLCKALLASLAAFSSPLCVPATVASASGLVAASALLFVQRAEGAALSTNRATYNGKTYAGVIVDIDTSAAGNMSSATYRVGQTSCKGTDTFLITAAGSMEGDSTQSGPLAFWKNTWNGSGTAAATYGHTLRLSGGCTLDFSPMYLGGLIAESTGEDTGGNDYEYTISSHQNANRVINLVSGAANVLFTIGANTKFGGNVLTFNVNSNTTFEIAAGKKLDIAGNNPTTVNFGALALGSGTTLTIRRDGEGREGVEVICGKITSPTNSTLVLEEGATLTLLATTEKNGNKTVDVTDTITKLRGRGTLSSEARLEVMGDDFSGTINAQHNLTLGRDFKGATVNMNGSSSNSLVLTAGVTLDGVTINMGNVRDIHVGTEQVVALSNCTINGENTTFTIDSKSRVSIDDKTTATKGVTIEVGTGKPGERFRDTARGTLDLGGKNLNENIDVMVNEGGSLVGIGAGTLELVGESALLVEGKNLWEDGTEAVLQYTQGIPEEKKLRTKVDKDGNTDLCISLGRDLTYRTKDKEFDFLIWLADAEVDVDESVLKVRTQGIGGFFCYAETELTEDGHTLLRLHGSREGVWNASTQGGINQSEWQTPSWNGGDGQYSEGRWKMVNVDAAMDVRLVEGGEEEKLQLNLLTGTADLTIYSEMENAATIVLHNSEDVDPDGRYTMDFSTTMQGNIIVNEEKELGHGAVNFQKTGERTFTLAGNVTAGKSQLTVSEGKVVLQGKDNVLGTIDEFGEAGENGEEGKEGTLQLEGKLTLMDNTTLEGAGSLIGEGDLAMKGSKTLTVAKGFQGVRSSITLDLNDDSSGLELKGGEEDVVQFGGIRGEKESASVNLGEGGKLVLKGGKEESYGGKLEGEGSITVCGGSKQTIIGAGDDSESVGVSLEAGWDGELHLQGEGSYKSLSVLKDKDEDGHDSYGKLYIECRDGEESRITMDRGGITLQSGTETHLELSAQHVLGGNPQQRQADGGALGDPLLSTDGKLQVERGAKLYINLVGAGSGIISEDPLELVLIQGAYFDDSNGGYGMNGEMKKGSGLEYTALLDIYYENLRVEFGERGQVVLAGDRRKENLLTDVANTSNSAAGSDLLWNTTQKNDPELSDTASALSRVFCGIIEQMESNPDSARKALAAVAGSGAAVLGSAQRDALRGQIGRMRDRATQLGLAEGYSYDRLPYWHAWVEGVGSYNKLNEDGNESGYTLSSWGGTLGVDVDLTENTAFGMAFTALRGDLKTNGADSGSGNLDSYYVSAMLRMQRRRIAHTVVASIGADDVELERRVNYGGGSYSSKGSTSGESFGALYELTYDLPGNSEGTALLQPLFTASVMHGSIKAYDETGVDALPLHVGKQDWTTATVGVGVRWMCTMGEETLNRSVIFEARGAVLQDMGDTQGKVRAALLKDPEFTREVESAEVGSTALQLGIGLRAPVNDRTQLLFNAGAELRSSMTSWNLAAGLRYDF